MQKINLLTRSYTNISSQFSQINWKFIVPLLIFACVYVYPLANLNESFKDDLGREVSHYAWNDGSGRFLATLLLRTLSFNDLVFPLAPYCYFVSAILYIFVGVIITKTLNLESEASFKISIGVFLTSPFLLENLVFKFDNIPMALSTLCAVLPFMYIGDNKKFPLCSIICLYMAFGLFQMGPMCFGAFFVCYLFERYISKKMSKKDIYTVGIAVFSFIVAFALYMFTCKLIGYTSSRGQLLPFDSSLPSLLMRNFKWLSVLYKQMWSSSYSFCWAIAMCFVVFTFLRVVFVSKHKVREVLDFFALFCLGITIVFITGIPNVIIKGHSFTARSMLCYPFLIYLLIVYLNRKSESLAVIKLSVVPFIYLGFFMCATFSSYFGNYLSYSRFIVDSVSNYSLQRGIDKVVVSGKIPLPPQNIITAREYPLMRRLVVEYEKENYWWSISSFSRYYQFRQSNGWYGKHILRDKCSGVLLKSNKIFNLRQLDNVLIVDFKRTDCKE